MIFKAPYYTHSTCKRMAGQLQKSICFQQYKASLIPKTLSNLSYPLYSGEATSNIWQKQPQPSRGSGTMAALHLYNKCASRPHGAAGEWSWLHCLVLVKTTTWNLCSDKTSLNAPVKGWVIIEPYTLSRDWGLGLGLGLGVLHFGIAYIMLNVLEQLV